MKAGAEIAKKILEEVEYPEDKVERIVHYISIHDNWALGDDKSYADDKILGVFNDLDFMWMATRKGFPVLMKILSKNKREMIQYLENDEKLTKRPFSTETTKRLFEKYLGERKNENN